jgi:4-alpha-glucanotransferase
MRFPRSSGILLHPTSLPGRYGIGDLGTAAYQFVDFLVEAGQSLWQILPLGPTGYGNSPYQSPSAFAGNPLLISLDALVEEGLLEEDEVSSLPGHFLIEDRVHYEAVSHFKLPLLKRASERFSTQASNDQRSAFDTFCEANANWLDDYALFMSLKDAFNDTSWNTWEQDIALRKTEAVKQWQEKLADDVFMHKFWQHVFFQQWFKLKAYTNERGVQIIGDIPIYVSYDSAEVWSNPNLYKLDKEGNPTVVAGVPPDYFSATGQRWGNPIYQWDKMAKKGFNWWIDRLKQTFTQVDIVRIDHFRGLESYWEVPADEETAKNGKWVEGPGAAFFNKLKRVFGEDLPIIAEDLGLITEAVTELRDKFELAGMKVLHFAFGDDVSNPYLPHNYESNYVVYTGTHDNDTSVGWFWSLEPEQREPVQRYLGRDGSDIAWDLIRLAQMSVADVSIFPIQDVLRLGSEGRMNLPGTSIGNWEWRLRSKMLSPGLAEGLRAMTQTYGRCE